MFPIPPGCGPLLRLQVVVARPGDESFACGSVLLYAASAGVMTAVTCATRGEGTGLRAGVPLPQEGLGRLRERELRTAAASLGVRRVRVLGLPDPDVRRAAVHEALAADVDAFGPDVLVTPEPADGDPTGLAVLDTTLEVAVAQGLPVYVVTSGRRERDHPEAAGVLLDTHAYLPDRWAAIRAYRSQGSPFDSLPADLARELLSSDRLVRVPATVPA